MELGWKTDATPEMKLVDEDELARTGILLEINRQFLHPLGLSLLFATMTRDGSRRLIFLDSREDGDGTRYAEDVIAHPAIQEKAISFARLRQARLEPRYEELGYIVQPVPGAYCEICGCTQTSACVDPRGLACAWLREPSAEKLGICTSCELDDLAGNADTAFALRGEIEDLAR
ncbi:MAG: hypothetical protein ACXW5U_19985 [Thermoanaerobaculia bacterium]